MRRGRYARAGRTGAARSVFLSVSPRLRPAGLGAARGRALRSRVFLSAKSLCLKRSGSCAPSCLHAAGRVRENSEARNASSNARLAPSSSCHSTGVTGADELTRAAAGGMSAVTFSQSLAQLSVASKHHPLAHWLTGRMTIEPKTGHDTLGAAASGGSNLPDDTRPDGGSGMKTAFSPRTVRTFLPIT